MAGLEIESLEELLRALGHERSLRGRLRVLGHAWQLLRQLSPAEREKVALRLGSSWAWKRVEKSFLRDGALDETEELVGRVFEHIGHSDPAELRKLASMVRSGDRAGTQDLLLLTLQEALEEEASAVEQSPAPGPWPFPGQDQAESEAELAPQPSARAVAEASVGPAAPRQESAPAEPEPRLAPPASRARLEPDPEPLLSVPQLLEPDPRVLEPDPQALEPDPRARASPDARVRDSVGGAERELVDSPGGVLASSLARAVESEPATPRGSWSESASAGPIEASHGAEPYPTPGMSPAAGLDGADRLRSLRSLHADPSAGADLGPQGRARLVEALGGGWASRRALSHMIAAGGIRDLNEALHLIGGLTRPGQRIWCLADLIQLGELDSTQVERVLAAAPTESARRRLARRAAAPPK